MILRNRIQEDRNARFDMILRSRVQRRRQEEVEEDVEEACETENEEDRQYSWPNCIAGVLIIFSTMSCVDSVY